MYEFQSLHRNHDLPEHKVSFKNFTFLTQDEKVASYVREVCKKNPNTVWEITEAVREGVKEDAPVVVPLEAQKRPGRPKKISAVRGFRSSDVAQGESV
jgi:hypothetical protein